MEAGSFSRAAERLFVSQPSVSKQIARYEAELGFPLLLRNTRTVRLTPQGKLLYQTLRELGKKWEDAVAAARLIDPDPHGALRVGMLYGWSLHRLPTQAFRRFQGKYPGVELTLEKHTYTELTERLMRGELDAALTIEAEAAPFAGLSLKHAYRDRLILLLGAGHPLAALDDALERLDGLDLYIMGERASRFSMRSVHSLFEQLRIHPRPNFESILLALDQGKGGTLTALSSAACEDPAYRYYDTGRFMDVYVAWRHETRNPMLPYFLAEFPEEAKK